MESIQEIVRRVLRTRAARRFSVASSLRDEERLSAWAPAIALAVEREVWALSALTSRCQSPLEEIFGAALLAVDEPNHVIIPARGDRAEVVLRTGSLLAGVLSVDPQSPVGPYFADFLITLRRWRIEARVAVELDGHDFHEKTKQQVEKGKRRDRYFTLQGVTTMRFAGSELVRSPASCVEEVMQALARQVDDGVDRATDAVLRREKRR